MDKIVIFGLDIDDCLSLEYYFTPNPSSNLTIRFRGELYNHLKFSIFMGYSSYGKRFLPVITSLSARASKMLDSRNVITNGIPSSALLLTALVQQLTIELNKPVILDHSFLFEQQDPATLGIGFHEILGDPLAALDAPQENLDLAILLSRAPGLGPLPQGTTNAQIKLLRARQVLIRVHAYGASLGFNSQNIEFYFYDDIQDYLNYLEKNLKANDFPVCLKTFLVNTYDSHEDKIFHLDRSEISKTSKTNISELAASAPNWNIATLRQQDWQPERGFIRITPNNEPLNINPLYPQTILNRTKRDKDDFIVRVLSAPFGNTAQDIARTEGFAWGQQNPETQTRYSEYIDWKDPQN